MKNFQSVVTLGYLLIALLIGGIAYTWYHEWQEVEALEVGNQRIDEFRKEVNRIHIRLIEFSLLGETVLDWDEVDWDNYTAQRIALDNMLCRFKNTYPVERVDSVRYLLEDKERQMFQIVRLMDEQQVINKKIASQVPVIVQKSVQEQSKKPKRKGFLGIFGKKEETKPTTTTTTLRSPDRNIVSEQKAQIRRLSEQADSLAARNAELNRQLRGLIHQIEDKVQSDLQNREVEITAMRERSFTQIGGLMGFILFLLVVSYIIIHRDGKRIKRYKRETEDLISQLTESVNQNKELINSRKKAMHGITHELRTPLAAIHGYAELIQKNNTETKIDRYSEHIRLSSQRMLAMLNSLLDFFRLDNGKEQFVSIPFRLEDIAQTLKGDFQNMAENKNLCLAIENNADVILTGDKNRILQIGNNLLSNAIKFTENGGVSMTTDYNNGVLTLVVEDTGSGMTEDEQQRVFTAFERLSNATAQDGFGLGLSVVKRIVDMLKGTIDLLSEKGKGSRFTVRLPMFVAETVSEVKSQDMTNCHIPTLCSVLVLDDNETLLSMIKEMYAYAGVCCNTFDNVGDMLEAMRKRNYDLLVTDMKMPEMNGYEVLELLRSSNIGNAKDIPVIVATASGSCDTEQLLAKGFAGCLFKPFTLEELITATENALKTKPDDDLPDLKSLLAYGDSGAMLDRLIAETEKDMQEFGKAGEELDRRALADLSHRLRSSWAVIRADNPLWLLYGYIQTGCSDSELQKAVKAVLKKGDMIIEQAKEERRKCDNG
ncbi:ATP-binding protein [uncultured Phocaeicola sp.]|jgi:signal transduction histidine kinase/DNA-binding response OmpR family regulator|uniref:hybrid sensor histidine kinase/response regulator n=1 Tax=uncultured Phocaeicola sp. TaxID=990718 RepID=UPI0025A178D2|nr:ATP-binding protein [uncultured Phocaeicola sp.]